MIDEHLVNSGLIPQSVAQHTLHFFYPNEGYEGGHFVSALLKAMSYADERNLKLLARSFPEYTVAFELASRQPGGIDTLRRIAA